MDWRVSRSPRLAASIWPANRSADRELAISVDSVIAPPSGDAVGRAPGEAPHGIGAPSIQARSEAVKPPERIPRRHPWCTEISHLCRSNKRLQPKMERIQALQRILEKICSTDVRKMTSTLS